MKWWVDECFADHLSEAQRGTEDKKGTEKKKGTDETNLE